MKKTCIIAALFGVGLFAENTIPAGAREAQSNTYSYTDAQGNQWMYCQTPFGVTKWQASDVPAPTVKQQTNPVTVTELGDQIRFERRTPFGQYVWTKKKSEISGDEKLLLQVAAESK